jgi:CelD/BcsL family acetyltransferase involved in cellulose biosynthesis
MHMAFETAATLSVERIPDLPALLSLRAEWEPLAAEMCPRTPFSSSLWIDLWWKHFPRNNAVFRDEFFTHVVRGADGRLIGVAPLVLSHCPSFGPSAMRIIQFIGNDPSLTEYRGVICRPEDHQRMIRALAEYFLQRRSEWDILRWSGLKEASSIYNMLPLRSAFVARGSIPDYVMPTPRNWAELKSRVSSNMRKNLRKAYEFLERDGVAFSCRAIERPEDVEAAIDRFRKLHIARAGVSNMSYHADKFSASRNHAFLLACSRRFAEHGQLRIFELEIDNQVVASRLTFIVGGDLYIYFSGYDPAWRRYSIMTVLMAEIIKWAIERNFQRINLSTGNDQSKLRWKPQEILFHNAVMISPTLRGRLSFPGFLTYEAVSRWRHAWSMLGRNRNTVDRAE